MSKGLAACDGVSARYFGRNRLLDDPDLLLRGERLPPAEALAHTLYGDHSEAKIDELKQQGWEVSGRYLPEVILPKWDRFLAQLTGKPTPMSIAFDNAPEEPS